MHLREKSRPLLQSLAVSVAALAILSRIPTVCCADGDYDYTGGVSLRYPNQTCPFNTKYIGTSYYANCCPKWTEGSPGGSGYCCESSDDCYVTVASNPKCADPSWTYCFDPDSDAQIGFCCLAGWTCIITSSGVGCNAPSLPVASFQDVARTSFSAYEIPGASSTTISISSPSKTPSTTSVRTPSAAIGGSSSPTPEPDGGLSTGAKAGIGTGAAIGGLALIGLGAWLALFLSRRRQGDQPDLSLHSSPSYDKAIYAHYTSDSHGATAPSELPSNEQTKCEAYGSSPIGSRAELATEWHGSEMGGEGRKRV